MFHLAQVQGAILAIPALIAAWSALLIALTLLFPHKAKRAETALRSTPRTCFGAGLGLGLVMACLLILLLLPKPGIRTFSTLLLLGLSPVLGIGLAGIVQILGKRTSAVSEEASGMGTLIRGSVLILLAVSFPMLGWFLIAPLVVLFSLGAGAIALNFPFLSASGTLPVPPVPSNPPTPATPQSNNRIPSGRASLQTRKPRLGLFWFCCCLASGMVGIIALGALKAHPTRTAMVPMRDGVRLATDIYLPPGPGPFPVILLRTPYNKEMNNGWPGPEAAQRGYVFVIQDTRGRYASEGEHHPFAKDFELAPNDGSDTLEWISAQPWCNGKIGTYGGSAGGITQLGEVAAGTRLLTCQDILVAPPSFYPYLLFPGGVFRKDLAESWLKATRFAPDSLDLWTQHSDYDAYMRQRDLTTHWELANSPVMHVGGWYDIFSQGTLESFVGFQTKGGPKARGTQKLVMGPWTHSAMMATQVGELHFPTGDVPPNQAADPWRWFDAQLKGIDNGMKDLPAVTYYVMGDVTDHSAPGNLWRTADAWPPFKTTETLFYLHVDRSLAPTLPAPSAPLTYAYDPRDPVPTVGGPQLFVPAGPMDQRKIESRPDMLVFTGAPLTQPLEVTGHVKARLWISSDCTDTDFFVKLCDVYPDGRSINLCEGQLRARFHDGFTTEHLLTPGKLYPLNIDLWSTSIIFNKGHRLRVLVTSSSAPGYDPNPNTGARFRADSRTQIAHNSLYLDDKHPSAILLPIH